MKTMQVEEITVAVESFNVEAEFQKLTHLYFDVGTLNRHDYLLNAMSLALEANYLIPIYEKIKSKLENYQLNSINKKSLEYYFVYAQFYYRLYEKTSNPDFLSFSYLLLRHCLMYREIYDIELSTKRYIENVEATIHQAYNGNLKLLKLTGVHEHENKCGVNFIQNYGAFSQNNSLDSLPNDVVIIIMFFLNTRDLVQISKTSKRFHHLSHNGQFWDNLERSEIVKDLNYILHIHNKLNNNSGFFQHSAKARIMDYYARPQPLYIEEILEAKIEKTSKVKKVYNNSNTAVICLILLLGLAAGTYAGITNDKNETNNSIGRRIFNGVFVGAATGIASTVGLSCTVGILYCLFYTCCKASMFGIEKTVNTLQERRLKPFRITDSQQTMYAPLRSSEQDPLIDAEAEQQNQLAP